jgi:hypothetical protein
MLKRLLAVALVAVAAPLPAQAGPAADLLREGLYSGELDAAATSLKPLADAGDQEAKFGLGLVTFVSGIEDVSQALYRHGATAPDGGPMASGMLGVPMATGPANPNPTPLDYDLFRTELDNFVRTLDAAATTLEAAGASGDYVIPVDILKLRIDLNEDGTADDSETVGTVMGAMFGMSPTELTGVPPPPSGGRTQSGATHTEPAPAAPSGEIGFDRADAIWLAGYSNVLAAQADFLLAHDFSEMFNATFHRLFPKAGLPMQQFSRGGMLALDPESDSAIADAIALIHTINWPVVEHERMLRVLARASTVTAMSRQNWDAILAETDDNHELVPSPRQTAIVPDGTVTDEMVAAWRATLDTVDRVLAGELLVPHWRFKQGFDLKAYFETTERTDFVMLLSGFGALPFLKDGPVADASSFAEANRVFGDNLLGYAFWFN